MARTTGSADAKTAGLWRPQLICLERYLDDPSLATSVNHAWSALTHACHHHPYELGPTTGELMQWIAVTRRFVEREA